MMIRLPKCVAIGLFAGLLTNVALIVQPVPSAAQSLTANLAGSIHKQGAQSHSLKEALNALENRFHVVLGYKDNLVINREVRDAGWQSHTDFDPSIRALLRPFGLTYKKISKNTYVIKAKNAAHDLPIDSLRTNTGQLPVQFTAERPEGVGSHISQLAITVTGTVTSMVSQQAIPGVNVIIKGTTTGTATDAEGKYTISVPGPEAVLVFSAVGYLAEEVTVGNQTTINVPLAEDVQNLSEITVVGYGTQQKKDITGAVSSVSGSEIQNLPSGGAQQALQGRASGVNVVRNGGAPGNAGSIRIRGLGTVNNADPLIVIDGVPAGTMNDVNPNDIQSIEVLKDASASAIYGTRAANGVVIITTKRGDFDKPLQLTVNGYTGISNRIKTLDVLDAPILAQLKREAYTNDGQDIPEIWQDPQYQTQRTNWQDELLKQGTTNNLDVSISGGGKYSSFALSGGYYNEQGIIGKSYYKRYTFRINSDHKVSNRLKVGQSLQFTNTHDNAPNTTSAQTGLLWSAIRFHPGLPVRNADGKYSSTQGIGAFGDINNPMYTVETQDQDAARNRFLGSVTGEYEILSGLKAKANLAMDAVFSNSSSFEVKIQDQFRTTPFNQLTLTNDKAWSFLQEYFLSYDKRFGNHGLSLVGGYTSQTFNSRYSAQRGREFPSESPELRYLRYAGEIVPIGGTNGEDGSRSYNALQSWFGRANYNFRDKYLATVTFRADGSSRFAPDNRWGYFPAFSLGWRLSEETFFKNALPFVDNLKLTGGWGQLGNQNVDPLQYLALINSTYRYAFGTSQPQNQVAGSAQSRLANPNIGWETAEMTNFGLEAGFLGNSLSFSANYFIKDTKDMLLSPPSIGTLGSATIPDQNIGQLRNQGLELEASYRKTAGDFIFSVGGNATFIKNEVTKLVTPGAFLAAQLYGRSQQEITRTYEGQPYGTFYGWRTNGLYQTQSEIDTDPYIANDSRRTEAQIKPGDVRFVDLNNDGLIDDQDRTVIGNPQPKVSYGLNAGVTYKGFDLTLFFLGVGGVDIYNADRMQGLDASYSFNLYAETGGRWTGQGSSNSIPRVSIDNGNRNFRTSDLFVEKGDFLRLKNLTLGYTLPKKVTDALRMAQARFYLTGQNLLTFTGYSGLNPELGYVEGTRSNGEYIQQNVDYAQYPQSRTWTVGATISF